MQSAVDGYNVCIFAYGQTGSGKTHTMSGSEQGGDGGGRGINFRALDDLFGLVAARASEVSYEIRVQMLEIYNETLRDLLVNVDAPEGDDGDDGDDDDDGSAQRQRQQQLGGGGGAVDPNRLDILSTQPSGAVPSTAFKAVSITEVGEINVHGKPEDLSASIPASKVCSSASPLWFTAPWIAATCG